MQRRSFLGGLIALPILGLFKNTLRDLSMWTNYPVNLTEPVKVLDPFIMVNLDNGPVTIGDLTFSVSDLRPIKLTYGRGPIHKDQINLAPSEQSIEKLRKILKSNDGGTINVIWGPETFWSWVRIDYKESGHSHLVPMLVQDHNKSDFIDSANREYGGLFKVFYHIQHLDMSNLWVRIYSEPKTLIPGKGFSHEA